MAQSYLFVTRLLDRLAQIVVVLNGEIPGREVIEQAMRYEADLFQTIFTDVILEATDQQKLQNLLKLIWNYLERHTEEIFRPVIDYFKTESDVRSLSDLTYHLNKILPSDWWEIAVLAYGEWLTAQSYLERFACPVRLTTKSRVQMQEVGYLYCEKTTTN